MVSSVTPQAKTLALLPKFTGFCSLCGSAFIFQDITCHGTTAPTKRVFHRVMLGLSISDAVASVVNILSTWPIPEGTPGVYLASGTTQTCTAQGFFNELGNVATPLYNASLCVYFVRKIRDGWTEDEIQNRNEKIMHSVPAAVATTIAVMGLIFDLYNNSGWLCWFSENPPGCSEPEVDCIRGQLAEPFRWAHYTIIWTTICFIGYQMYSIYRFVKVQERIQYADSIDEEGRHRGTKAKKVAIQAGLFVGALYLTWFFTTVSRIYQNITGHNHFVLQLLMAIFFPLQGFFNSLIYIRPRYLRARSRNPQFSANKLFRIALHHDGHPLHGTSTRPVSQLQRDQRAPWQRRRESPAASDYSIGPIRQYGQSTDGESINEDGLYSVADTINARADESEFQNKNGSKNTTNASVAEPQPDDGFPNEDTSSKNGGNTTSAASDTRSPSDDGASNQDCSSKNEENTSSASGTTAPADDEADVSSKSSGEQFQDNPR